MVLRVVFRLGLASAPAASPAALSAAVADVLRVVRRLGAGASAASVPGSALAEAGSVAAALVAVFRVERFFGAADWPSSAGAAPDAVVLRVVRRFGAVVVAASVPAASAVVASAAATASAETGRVSVGRDSVVPGFWLTWARSIASSSGGTSLHGSLDEVARGAASRGRSSRRAGPRSSRGPRFGAAFPPVRPLTSG